jgi:hypothetical protein
MNKLILTLLLPPLSACKYGCAGLCALPITVFWASGIIGIIYGLNGGLGIWPGIDWIVIALSVSLILISVVWTYLTINKAETESCSVDQNQSRICKTVNPMDKSDPLDEIKKARQEGG